MAEWAKPTITKLMEKGYLKGDEEGNLNLDDNPPIGIVHCADKSDAIVKYTLAEDNNQIYASKYKLYMPTEEEFKKELKLDDFEKISE